MNQNGTLSGSLISIASLTLFSLSSYSCSGVLPVFLSISSHKAWNFLLCGCDESSDEDTTDPSLYTVIEAIAQVVNSTGQPVEGESVTIEFQAHGAQQHSFVKTTDSTGWSGFASEAVNIPEQGWATCKVYLTNNDAIREFHVVYHSEAKNKAVDGVYYWSISARLVKE